MTHLSKSKFCKTSLFEVALSKCIISVTSPHYDLEVSAWLMGSVNSGEWGDDLPPHPSPSDGHGKPVPDRLWGRRGGGYKWG